MSTALPIWAVVPVKEVAAAKQRLAAVLSPSQRRALALAMLEDVFAALAATRGLAGILSVTTDGTAAAIAQRFGVVVSPDDATSGHTAAVSGAAHRLAASGAAMLTLPGDIPLTTSAEIAQIIASHNSGNAFTIVPARDERGSNAILCAPADAVSLRFGEDSFFPHVAAARACGIEPAILPLPGIGLDIDTPDDLAAFLAVPSHTKARAWLDAQGVTMAVASPA
jgi:2-phospho-L-lactate/phosphoenolpyruvate guanylyltransferase